MRAALAFAAAFLVVGLASAPVSASPPPCKDHSPCPPTPAVAMGRLLTAGFETQSNTLEGYTTNSGTLTFDSTVVNGGGTSLKVVPSGGTSNVRMAFTGVLGRTYFFRTYFYITDLGTGFSTDVIGGVLVGPAQNIVVTVGSDGVLQMRGPGVTTYNSPVGTVQAATWYRLELSVLTASGAGDAVEVRLNGTSLNAQSSLSISDNALTQIDWTSGWSNASSPAMYLDDIAINDDQGASQNTWPGPGKVVLLIPTATSAGGTGWTDDNASSTATNLRNAVDNTPPNGIADTTSGGGNHQDRNATNNANSNLDMTMTTYSAAGVPAGATINVVDPITATAAPVSTGAKQGTVGVVSNPAITNIALAAGGTSGAFWSGTAAGTYPTGWKISHGTVTYAPSVTLGTAPVMRVTQVTSSTRIAMVTFMGMYVDYTPPGALAGMLQVQQAINRSASW